MAKPIPPQPARRWVDLKTAADYLGVSELTVRRRIADGTIPASHLGARTIRIDLNDIDAAMRPVPTGLLPSEDD